MSRPNEADIQYTSYSTTHSTMCTNQWPSWLLEQPTYIYRKPDAQL